MRPGSSTFLVRAGLVAGLTTSTWTVGEAANALPTGQPRIARLAAKATAIPVTPTRCPAARSNFFGFCGEISPEFGNIELCMSVFFIRGPHWTPRPVVRVNLDARCFCAMLRRGGDGFSCFRPRSTADRRRQRRFERLVIVLQCGLVAPEHDVFLGAGI